MFKFVATDVDVLEGKKRSTARACKGCRKRKKRCPHSEAQKVPPCPTQPPLGSEGLPASTSTIQHGSFTHEEQQSDGNSPQLNPPKATPSTENHASFNESQSKLRRPERDLSGGEAADPHHDGTSFGASETHNSRFIGDLNPEGVFLAATNPESARGSSSSRRIGVWLAEKLDQSGKQVDRCMTQTPSSLFSSSTSVAQKMFLHILEEECLTTLPPSVHREALCAAYFEKIHPIFPIINQVAYQNFPPNSPARVLLQQGMCLAASMDFVARSHLVLPDSGQPLAFIDFGRRLLTAMRISVEIALVTDKTILMQALALMSFFTDGLEGREISSLIIGRAVQYVYSLGLHIEERHRVNDQEHEYARTLFCCIWTLDRLNAAFQGRPVLMHERDIEISLQQCFDEQIPPFKLLLHVVLLLDRVIMLYRPQTKDAEMPSKDFSLFEELVVNCGALQVPTYLLATTEVLYHAAAILSCRSGSSDTNLHSSASHIRQSLSASRVTAIVGHEFRDQLVLLPFIPYTMSLSLSVAYREMRRNKVPMCRARARNDMQSNCRILERLGEIFWSASVMAEMGNMTLKELDRVYSDVAEAQSRKQQQHSSSQQNTGNSNAPTPRTTPDLKPLPKPHCSSLHRILADHSRLGGMQTPDTMFNPNNAHERNPSLAQEFNPFLFTEMPGIDPFEMFDPNFALDVIDTCLEGNLDLAFPTNLQ